MRVLLISSNLAEEPFAVFPLGLGVIAKSLTDSGHKIKIYDNLLAQSCNCSVAEYVHEFKPEVIGVGIRNIDNVNYLEPAFFLDDAAMLIKEIRQICGVPIFAGGAGFSLMPERVLEYIGADYGIAGAGEKAAVELVDRLARDETPERISRGVNVDGDFGRCSYEQEISRFYLAKTGTLPIQTKRGCPKKCVYCSYPSLEGRRVLSRDPETVIDELIYLQREFSPESIYFTDSVFNDTGGEYLVLLEAMVRRGVNLPWCAFFTPQKFDRESIELMKRSGLKTIELGIDACSDRTLVGLGKDYDFATVFSACEAFRASGLKVSASYITGGPGEDKHTMNEGIKNLRALDWISSFVFMGIRILPGTAIEAIAKRQGVIKPDEDLLKPKFYLSPDITQQALWDGLTEGFKDVPVIFPPQSRNKELKFFRKLQMLKGVAKEKG